MAPCRRTPGSRGPGGAFPAIVAAGGAKSTGDCRPVKVNARAAYFPGDSSTLPRYLPSVGSLSASEIGVERYCFASEYVTDGEHFLNIYYSFTFGMLNRLRVWGVLPCGQPFQEITISVQGLGIAFGSVGGVSGFEPSPTGALAFSVRGNPCCGDAWRLRPRKRHRHPDAALAATALAANDRGDRAAEHEQGIPDPRPHLQGRVRARGLEGRPERPHGAAQDLSDLPLVGRSRSEDQARRPPGARGVLHDHAEPDESELQLLPLDQSWLSERL